LHPGGAKYKFRPVDLGNSAMIWRAGVRALGIGLLIAGALVCPAEGIHLESAGARVGFYFDGAGSNFHEAEGFMNWNLPLALELGSSWYFQSRMDFSAGWLGDSGVNAAIVTAGLTVVLGRPRLPVSFEIGASPTVISRADFPAKDFGIPIQFTSHAGLNVDLFWNMRLSYRFQHMSNASLSPHNPGLNLHMVGLSYVF
jgi:hypothetical protein